MDRDWAKSNSGVVVPEEHFGTCLWELPNDSKWGGGYIADADKNYLSMDGIVGSVAVENLMAEAARSILGERVGKPHWIRGARKVTHGEWEMMQERLEDGLIPDPIEAARVAMREGR